MSDDDIFASTKKAKVEPPPVKIDISDFKPRPAPDIDDAKADRIAEKAGFVSREPTVRVEKVRKKNQIQDTVYVRGPIDMTNRFKQFCNTNGFSYGEGLDALMRKVGI